MPAILLTRSPHAPVQFQAPSASLKCTIARVWGLVQVREVSRRLLALRQLLGARDDVDVVWMVVREPGLLSADFRRWASMRHARELGGRAWGQA